jgi:transposase-like protein
MGREAIPMDLRLMAAATGPLSGVNVSALCREHGISTKTFYKWRARYAADGLAGLEPRSRRPHRSPRRVSAEVEEAIVALRKELSDAGLDAGAATLRWHLARRRVAYPPASEATIWRVLVRRGFVVPQPEKRPKSSLCRFEAAFPNECWQIDATEWALADLTVVQIFNVLDDHSRLAVASRAVPSATTEAAWAAFSRGCHHWGVPWRCLSDNGLCFSGKLRGYQVFFETQLRAAGVRPVTSRPFHPQTCGKVCEHHRGAVSGPV